MRAKWIAGISTIDREQWDRLALPLKSPFLEWNWLNLMERSRSIAPETGWLPKHLTVYDGDRLVAAAPLYAKYHSEGEFVSDYAWAEAASRLGVSYYPKMVGACPVTPVAGYRFLIDPEFDEFKMTRLMLEKIDQFCLASGYSACNFLFVEPSFKRMLERLGRHAWIHQSFIWKNRGFATFDDYLAQFRTNQRRNIRRERKAMEKQGLFLKNFAGKKIPEEFFSYMYDFYVRTNDKFGPWGCKYLSREFFGGLCESFGPRLLMTAAFHRSSGDEPVGMSLLVAKGDQLYGRYWGCSRKFDSLHFNACYYHPIQWAIENGISFYNPGAGGAHKIRRGFLSVPSFCMLKFYDSRMQNLMLNNIRRINLLEIQEIEAINRQVPFARQT